MKHSSQINNADKVEICTPLRVNTIESDLATQIQLCNGSIKDNNRSIMSESFVNKEEPFYEHSKIGWDGPIEELVLFMMIEDC